MPTFVATIADGAARKPSKIKQDATVNGVKNESSKIKWMETVLVYSYLYTESTQVLAEERAIRGLGKPAQCKSRSTSKFRFESDASINVQKKKLVQHKARFENMMPDLARFQLSNLSLEEMGKLEYDIIDKLDGFQRVDNVDGCFCHSDEYRVLEKKLARLLEAQECVYRIKCIDTFLGNNQQYGISDNKFKLRTSIQHLIPFIKCFGVNED